MSGSWKNICTRNVTPVWATKYLFYRYEIWVKDCKRWRIHYHPKRVVSVLITLTLYFQPDLPSFSPQTLLLLIFSYVKEQRLIWLTAIPSSCSCTWTGAQPPLHFYCSQQRTASGPQINSTAVFWSLSKYSVFYPKHGPDTRFQQQSPKWHVVIIPPTYLWIKSFY